MSEHPDGRSTPSGDLSDEALSRLYRAAERVEPPAQLDAAILAAARIHAAPRRSAAPFAGRWRVPLALAAVVLLTVTLVPLLRHAPSQRALDGPPAAEIPLALPEAAPAPGGEDNAPAVLLAPPASEGETGAALPLYAPAKAPMPPAAAMPPSALRGSPARQGLEQRTQSDSRAKKVQSVPRHLRSERALAPAPQAASDLAQPAPREARQLAPEEWLARIRQLLASRQTAEARREIKAFRDAFPDYPLDDDITRRLRESNDRNRQE